jgi:RNA-directed DNA polymerase
VWNKEDEPMDRVKAEYIAEHLDNYYTKFSIAKRKHGRRAILAPSPALKELQKEILKELESKTKLVPSRYATCVRGKGIVYNALAHRGNKVVVKLDVKNFYWSISTYHLDRVFRSLGLDDSTRQLYYKLCTYRGHLPIGAPTSSYIADLCMAGFDKDMACFARDKFAAVYTRYADDITFSSNERQLNGIIPWVRSFLKEYKLRVNKNKVRILRDSNRQIITGLITNQKVNIPRDTYRIFRARLHKACSSSSTSEKEICYLQGMIAYFKAVNEDKASKLEAQLNAYLVTRSDLNV